MKAQPPQTLNDVCEFIVDCLHATAPTETAGFPLIRTPNIGKGRLDLNDVYRVSEATYHTWTTRAVPEPGDLILAREAPAGNVAIVKDGQKVCLGQRTVHLRPNKEKVDPDFLCYFLLAPSQQGKLLAGETGATAKHVNMRDIRRLELSGLPGLSTQQAAGPLLAAYDDLIENNRRRMELLEEMTQHVYREWFVNLRFPGHEHTHITDGVPERWERRPLVSCTTFRSGGTPSKGRTEYWDGEIPWVSSGEMSETRIYDTPLHISSEAADVGSRLISPDTILIVVRGMSLAKEFRLATVARKMAFNQDLKALEAKDGVDPLFLFQSLFEQRSRIRDLATEASHGTKKLDTAVLEQLPILVAEPRLQRLFRDTIAPSLAQRDNLYHQNTRLRAARDLLLPRLMSGEIAV